MGSRRETTTICSAQRIVLPNETNEFNFFSKNVVVDRMSFQIPFEEKNNFFNGKWEHIHSEITSKTETACTMHMTSNMNKHESKTNIAYLLMLI